MLCIAAAPVSDALTGVAIRTVELARVLAEQADVTIAGVEPTALSDLPATSYRLFGDPRRSGLAQLIDAADVIVAQPPWPLLAARLRRSRARLIYDLYDPEPLEVVERLRSGRRALRRLACTLTVDRVLDGLASADHVICASEKQRDLWIGAMLAERLLNPAVYDADPSMRERLDTVPFGLPVGAPVARGSGAREAFAQISAEDEVILWNGGIWAWLDASSAIRALALLRQTRPRARLVFMGSSSLPAAVDAQRQARELARSLGLLDSHVFFNERWVDYERRADWLLDASCVICTQDDHLETRFAFRTRVLDALWARRPLVCTSGDDLATLVERERLGELVPPREPAAIAAALERVLAAGPGAYERQLAATAERFAWSVVARPLCRWVAQGAPAPTTGSRRPTGRPLQRLREAGFRTGLRALNTVRVEQLPPV
ncbi:MAG: glycosyltransferase family 4 protein [Solirubrobacteraceae bacterium]